jgi:5-methyltetrahydropteroyltriglutamate--homocysteine methyltransferase
VLERSTPPFRADHVGSLLRPPALLNARDAHRDGRLSPDELRGAEDEAIAAVVARQRDAGLLAVTDGEYRRDSWHMDFILQLGGVRPGERVEHVKFFRDGETLDYEPPEVGITDRITLPRPIFAEAFSYLRAVAGDATAKITIPSPSMVIYRAGQAHIDRAVYPDVDEFWSDLVDVYVAELEALDALGCRYLQIDDVALAAFNDSRQRGIASQRGADGEHLHETCVRTITEVLARKPDEMAVTMHMCRGNFRSSWTAEGGYDYVAESIFSLPLDGFFMEYDDERSGGFEPLRYVPPGPMIVLGLVTTKRGELESKDLIKRRIEEATAFVPLEQLCLSPQCGFASTVEGNELTIDEQWRKLELVVEVAQEVWG